MDFDGGQSEEQRAFRWAVRAWLEQNTPAQVAVPADDEGTDFSALLATDKVPADLSCEHMWFAVTAIERGGTFRGVLHNDPVMARFMERDCEYTLPVSQISGFHLIVGDRSYGPDSIGELDARI